MKPKEKTSISILVIGVAVMASVASLVGILSSDDFGISQFVSIHGTPVNIYGKGIYRLMSTDVAIQGIAQDYVTLMVAIPILLIRLYKYLKESIKGAFILSGTLGYFFVTYLFYTAMAVFNELFLVYVILLGFSFFALLGTLLNIELKSIDQYFKNSSRTKAVGFFLIASSILIGLLWLSIIVPPLIDGTIIPESVQHYTTLIVQGFDLGLLLPLSFVSGLFLLQKRKIGYLASTSYIIFLSILMTALTAKVFAMMVNNVNVMPAIIIIPTMNIIAIVLAFLTLKSMKTENEIYTNAQQ